MTEVAAALLHPSLHKLAAVYRRRLRLSGLLIFLLFGGLLLYAMVAALTGATLKPILNLWLMGLLVVPAVAVVAGVMRYGDRLAGKKLTAAHHMLSSTASQPAWLQSRDAAGSKSRWVTLQLPNGDRIDVVFSDPTALNLVPAGSALQLHAQSLVPGSIVVALRPDGVALLGQIVDPPSWQRHQRAKQMVLAVTVLAGAMLAVLFYWA